MCRVRAVSTRIWCGAARIVTLCLDVLTMKIVHTAISSGNPKIVSITSTDFGVSYAMSVPIALAPINYFIRKNAKVAPRVSVFSIVEAVRIALGVRDSNKSRIIFLMSR